MLRLEGIFKRELSEQGYMTHNMKAMFVLGALLIVVIGLTYLCIIVPLLATADRASLKGVTPLIAFISGILDRRRCYAVAFVAFLLANNQAKTTECVVLSNSLTPLLDHKVGH
jgi:hypothetical protein